VRVARRQLGPAWVGLGLAGSIALTAAASQILHRPVRWWFVVDLGASAHVVFWAGVAALCVAWLGLGLVEHAGRRMLLVAGGLWALPLLVGPALFSGDVYSYLADGNLLRHGIDPYHHGPAALAGVHQARVLATVSPIWRHSTAPYGPLFVGLAAVASAIAGSHLVFGVLLMRALELPGLVLLAVFVPRLARTLGADPDRATWLAVVSPLVLLELVGGGHNDALMAGLLVAGIAYAAERRHLVAIALCTCAALIKLPAAAAIAFVVVCWARDTEQVARALARGALLVGGIVTAAGLATTVGFNWLSGSLLSSTTRLHLAVTPSTAIGYTLHAISGAGGSAHPLESGVGTVALALTACFGVWLLWRVDRDRLASSLAALLVATILAGPAMWPWYLAWGLVLLAAAPRVQLHPLLPGGILAATVVIGPGGQLSLPIGAAPYVLAVYAAVVVLLALGRTRPGSWRLAGPRVRGARIEMAR
jgi:hypothetical protein